MSFKSRPTYFLLIGALISFFLTIFFLYEPDLLYLKELSPSKILTKSNELIQSREGIVKDINYEENFFIVEYIDSYTLSLKKDKVFFGSDTRFDKDIIFKEGAVAYSWKRVTSTEHNIRVGESVETISVIRNNQFHAFYIRHGDTLFSTSL